MKQPNMLLYARLRAAQPHIDRKCALMGNSGERTAVLFIFNHLFLYSLQLRVFHTRQHDYV